jgi:hypothetical protein
MLKKTRLIRFVLFSNGVVDLLAAITLFFPIIKFPLPGTTAYNPQLAFVAGGWGIAAFTFGIGRIWASYKPEFYGFMALLGILEGSILSAYCFTNVFFLEISWLQAILPLSVGSIYSILYVIALLPLSR